MNNSPFKQMGSWLSLLLASILWVSGMAINVIVLDAAEWLQLQGDAGRSGNVPTEILSETMGLQAAVPLTDGVYASPVASGDTVFVIDGSGVVFAINVKTFKVKWRFKTKGGPGNCNNVAAPAVIGKYLHVGTMAGYYYVLDCATGAMVKTIDCAEPIFSAPAVGQERVYFATL